MYLAIRPAFACSDLMCAARFSMLRDHLFKLRTRDHKGRNRNHRARCTFGSGDMENPSFPGSGSTSQRPLIAGIQNIVRIKRGTFVIGSLGTSFRNDHFPALGYAAAL